MQEKEVKVEVKAEGNELTIRTGQAPENPKPRVPVTHTGTIGSVVDYYTVRKADLSAEMLRKTLVKYSREQGVIVLHINEDHHLKDVIEGKIELTDEIEDFGINVDSAYFSPAELAKLCKMNRHLFDSESGFKDLHSKLNNFSATIHTVFDKKDDERGNANLNFERTMQTLIPEFFVLNCQLIKGQPNIDFKVEIGIKPTQTGARIWLMSHELVVKFRKAKDDILDKALENFTDHPRLEY